MASYSLVFKKSVAKDLRRIPRAHVARLLERIELLAAEPRPADCEKLSGYDRYRIRQGQYRVIYEVHDHTVTVIVVKIGHRREVYRG